MSGRGARILRIVGTSAPGDRSKRVGGEDVILVGDTASIKGTKGDTGPAGPAWDPDVDTEITVDLEAAPIGAIAIEVSEGVTGYLPVYAAATGG